MKLLIIPILVASACTGLWLLLRLFLGQYLSGDEGAMTSGTIAFFGIVYGIFATLLLVTVWNQWNAVEDAVNTKDRKEFDRMAEKRIPPTVKVLLFALSVLPVAAFFLTSFQHGPTGAFSIFGPSLIVAGVWAVIMDLDDPFEGVWNVEVPEEWR